MFQVLDSQNRELISLERENRELKASLQKAASMVTNSNVPSVSAPVPAVRRHNNSSNQRNYLGMLEYRAEDLTKILRAIIFGKSPSNNSSLATKNNLFIYPRRPPPISGGEGTSIGPARLHPLPNDPVH